MRARRCGLVLGTAAALVLSAAVGAASAAAFSDGTTAGPVSLSATTLAPVTELESSTFCESGLLGLLGNQPVIRLTWTRSAQISGSTSPLRGHDVRVVVGGTTYDAVTRDPLTGASSGTDVVAKQVTGGGAVTALAKGTSHQLLVRSAWGQWRSVEVSRTQSTLSGLNLACL